jgi:fructose-bisphosphate aldolase, class I
MKTARLNRLFHPKSGRCFDVAIDHGFFNEHAFLAGIEDIERAVATLVAAAPDAIQLTVGQAPLLQALPGRQKPALVLRTDVANVYGKELPRRLFSRMIHAPVEQALRLDAASVVVNLFAIPNQPEVADQCIENILRIKPDCDRYGMPLMIEPLVFRPNEKAGGYMVDGDVRKILPLVRQAVELGADIIKADPTDDVSEYHTVIEIAGRRPVLVRGGGKATDEEILQRTEALMQQGAAGIVYGRNVIQHQNPPGMTRALLAIVHDGATAKQAAALLKEHIS